MANTKRSKESIDAENKLILYIESLCINGCLSNNQGHKMIMLINNLLYEIRKDVLKIIDIDNDILL